MVSQSLINYYPLTDRAINKTSIDAGKIQAAKDFLLSYDQMKTGMIPLANFVKIMRILAVPISQATIAANEVGMVEYEKVLQDLATNK